MSTLQTWLLYKNAISAGVAIDDILKYARRTKDDANHNDPKEESIAAIVELKKQVAAQDALIKQLLASNQQGASVDSAAVMAPSASSMMLPSDCKQNSLSSSHSRVHFDDAPPAAHDTAVPVRRPFASAAASTTTSLTDVDRRADRRTVTQDIPIASARAQTPPKDSEVVSPKRRPSTPHAVIRKPSDSSIPAQSPAAFVSTSMQEQSWPMMSSYGEVPGLHPNNSFPVRSKPRSVTKKDSSDRSLDSAPIGGTASTPPSLSADFVFKVPDSLPPRVIKEKAEDSLKY